MNNSRDYSAFWLRALLLWYFIAYLAQTLLAKAFTNGSITWLKDFNWIPIDQMKYMTWSTIGSFSFTILIILLLRWPQKFQASFPGELKLLGLAGICTAVIVPTTTLMYTFRDVSIVAAMVIMRGSLIVFGRLIDLVQSKIGLLRKKVSLIENIAALLGLAAVGFALLWPGPNESNAEPKQSPSGNTLIEIIIILSLYLLAYFIRLYIMNYYKNRKANEGTLQDSRAYFAIENIFAAIGICLAIVCLWIIHPVGSERALNTYIAISSEWNWLAVACGVVFGLSAIPSVFILIIRNRTGTFAAAANRLTSLAAGTIATIILMNYGGKIPKTGEWIGLALTVIAVSGLTYQDHRQRN